MTKYYKLIHSDDPQSRPVGITVFSHVVRSYVRPSPLSNLTKQNKQKTIFATGETVGLAEWIIVKTFFIYIIFVRYHLNIANPWISLVD